MHVLSLEHVRVFHVSADAFRIAGLETWSHFFMILAFQKQVILHYNIVSSVSSANTNGGASSFLGAGNFGI